MNEQSNERLQAIEGLVRMIVDLDVPKVSKDEREVLIQHLTGAVFVFDYRRAMDHKLGPPDQTATDWLDSSPAADAECTRDAHAVWRMKWD